MKVKLSDITKSIYDGKHGGCKPCNNSGYYFVSVKDLLPMDIDYKNAMQISKKDFDEIYNRTKLENGDILYANTGDTIGKSILVKNNKLTSFTAFQKSIAVIKPLNDVVDSGYLYYKLKYETPYLRSRANGSSQKNLLLDTMRNYEMEIQSLDKQKSISSCLSMIDDKISINNCINDNLQQLIDNTYSFWFENLNFPDSNSLPYKLNNGKMIYNHKLKREIPVDWIVKPFLDISYWETNSQPPKSVFSYEPKQGYVRFIQNRDYDSDEYKTYIPYNKSLSIVGKYDILMDKYGDAGTVRYGIEGAFNVALAKIGVNRLNMQEYVRSFLRSKAVYMYLHNACMASTRASLSEENLKSLIIPIPSEDTLNKFENYAHILREKILSNSEENRKLIKLRDELLPLLMNGQVSIA